MFFANICFTFTLKVGNWMTMRKNSMKYVSSFKELPQNKTKYLKTSTPKTLESGRRRRNCTSTHIEHRKFIIFNLAFLNLQRFIQCIIITDIFVSIFCHFYINISPFIRILFSSHDVLFKDETCYTGNFFLFSH